MWVNQQLLRTYGNDYTTQLGIQVLGSLIVIVWSFSISYIILGLINRFIPLRVPEKSEQIGLNIAEHGAVSELALLVGQLEKQSTTEQFSPLGTDSFSELYPIAQQYNLILNRFLHSQSAMKQNIAALEELRDQLQSQKDIAETANQHKTEFLAKMSHEIRTPLNGIISLAELLNDETLTSEQKQYITIILQSGQSLLAIINDILDFSKIEAGKLALNQQPYHLKPLLEQCIAAFTAETLNKPIELKLDIQSKAMPEQFNGDSGRIRQIIMNLLGNAFKFTEQGQIKLSADYDPVQELLTVTVSDTGKGIADHRLGDIFQSFEQEDNSTQRKFGGSGLGLTISKQLVALMGGDIWVESTLGKGSCFYFRIKSPAISPDIS
ncbi:ATP-binding protein [Endozoicomonas sp. Mp262]|uniref:sensor histidine kinase n=1 Tax=Endozoicomonas sp. Mp262 TaxID=2919499 RepID=UPI0021D8589D